MSYARTAIQGPRSARPRIRPTAIAPVKAVVLHRQDQAKDLRIDLSLKEQGATQSSLPIEVGRTDAQQLYQALRQTLPRSTWNELVRLFYPSTVGE